MNRENTHLLIAILEIQLECEMAAYKSLNGLNSPFADKLIISARIKVLEDKIKILKESL